jgi:hypothetical protein
LRRGGEPGWDRTNDLLIKSLLALLTGDFCLFLVVSDSGRKRHLSLLFISSGFRSFPVISVALLTRRLPKGD